MLAAFLHSSGHLDMSFFLLFLPSLAVRFPLFLSLSRSLFPSRKNVLFYLFFIFFSSGMAKKRKQATVEERWEIVNYSPYASHVDIYLGFLASAFSCLRFLFSPRTLPHFLRSPWLAGRYPAGYSLSSRWPRAVPEIAFAQRGLEFVSLYFFFSVFLIRSDSKAEVRFGLRAAACLVRFGK